MVRRVLRNIEILFNTAINLGKFCQLKTQFATKVEGEENYKWITQQATLVVVEVISYQYIFFRTISGI
jgi:ribosomal silencing factor RsfS